MQMGGLGGLEAWRWIFIMEGILTVIIGALAVIFLVGYPQDMKQNGRGFLTEGQVSLVLARIEEDRRYAEPTEAFNWSNFLQPALDLRIWAYGFLYT
jgi:hypothetical protein